LPDVGTPFIRNTGERTRGHQPDYREPAWPSPPRCWLTPPDDPCASSAFCAPKGSVPPGIPHCTGRSLLCRKRGHMLRGAASGLRGRASHGLSSLSNFVGATIAADGALCGARESCAALSWNCLPVCCHSSVQYRGRLGPSVRCEQLLSVSSAPPLSWVTQKRASCDSSADSDAGCATLSIDRSGLLKTNDALLEPSTSPAKEPMTELGKELWSRIRFGGGPMTVAEFMGQCLTAPTGYYTSGDVFGARGDFTTSPEISQMFG